MKKTAPMSLNQLKRTAPTHQPTPVALASVSFYPVHDLQFMLFNGPDMISRQLRSGQLWESSLIELLKHFLSNLSQPILLDIGANLGSITIPMGKLIQKMQGKVYSFEAQRGVYYQLCGNIFANQLSNTCHAYNIAIGNQETEINIPILDLQHEKNVGSLSLDENIRQQQRTLSTEITQFEKVSMTTIDLFQLPAASLIKIDVEGLELEVLQGAQNFIQKSNYPPIFFEVWGDYMQQQIEKREQLMQFVHQNLGYETVLFGELCIAQHPDNKFFDIKVNRDRTLEMTRLK